MILPQVSLYSINNGGRPLNYDGLETILLVEVSVHVLLHGLPRLFESFAFPVKLDLAGVDVLDHIFQLL